MANEVLTPEQMYRSDEIAAATYKISSLQLMENAGKAVAIEIEKRFGAGRAAILCGPGNNGGDGFVAARLLAAKKWSCDVFTWSDLSQLRGDAAAMAAKWRGKARPIDQFGAEAPGVSHRYDVIVDALFGAGLSKDFPAEIANRIMGAELPVVAVDVPSGVDGLTGHPRGSSLKADVTVTFFRKKPAHLLYPGRSLCGDIVVADIGIPPGALDDMAEKVELHENAKPVLPHLQTDGHKYRRGGVIIVSGEELNTGAARLAALAAARSGAGAVAVYGSKDALRIHAAHVSSIMLRDISLPFDAKFKACCIGPACGVSASTMGQVDRVLSSQMAVVLDADGLTSFDVDPSSLFDLISSRGACETVMTPHEGEFARLFPDIASSELAKHEKARAAAARSGAIVVYKGPDTVVAHPLGQAVINSNGTPKLATAGSGDVLAGLITGLMAQGMSGFAAASAGVWLHADAASRIPRRSIVAEDIIEALET